MRKHLVLLVVAIMLLTLVVALAEGNEVATFQDPMFEMRVRELLNRPGGDIYSTELSEITVLDFSCFVYSNGVIPEEEKIRSLTDLKYFPTLEELHIGGNAVSDLTPLASLKKLSFIEAAMNQITDISPLEGMTQLTWAVFWENGITDISPVSGLVNLETFSVFSNNVSDFSPLSNLTKLKTLELHDNPSEDFSVVSNYYDNLEEKDFEYVSSSEDTSVESTSAALQAGEALTAANAADELRNLMTQCMGDGDLENVYLSVYELAELQPDNANTYLAAADSLLAMIRQNEQILQNVLALGITSVPESEPLISGWLADHGMEGVIELPFIPDYAEASQINAAGNSAGNMTNALRDGYWRGGFVATQAGWIYFSRFTEDTYAIYKMRSDGSERQRLGMAYGYSLNVVGDWLYFVNPYDESKPYRIRTDGSHLEKIADITCSFLSVSGDWAYADGGDNITLCRFRTDGSELIAMTNYPVINGCVYGDWIYFCKKSMEDGGLLRMRADGTETQILVSGIPEIYAVTGDMVYYINPKDGNSVMQCDLNGGNPQEIFRAEDRITAMNVSGTTLIVAYGISFDKDGLTLSNFVALVDLPGGMVQRSWEAHTEPLCVGEGCVFYTEDSEGMRWHCVNLDTGEDVSME